MQLWDYHTHNKLCHHAVGVPEEYVQSAISKNLAEIGLSDHFPMQMLPKEADVWKYSMTMEEYPVYLEDCKRLREKYKSQITIKIATEADYFPAVFPKYKEALKPYLEDLDYLLGSIHVLQWDGIDAFGVDDDIGKAMCQTHTADKVYSEYFKRLGQMAKDGKDLYNIVGHCDLPKKFGVRPEHPEGVWEETMNFLDAVEAAGIAVEINTSGFRKPVKEQYPAERIIKELIARKIPITLGSDAHAPAEVGHEFTTFLAKVKKWGLTHLCQWTRREPTLIKIN